MAIDPPTDGRRARRARNRVAVIGAMFELLREGKLPPSVEDVAQRAGVSVSFIFRNFDGLADLQHKGIQRFQAEYSHLFDVDDADADQASRIRSHVRLRVELYGSAGGMMRIARARALDHEPLQEAVAHQRGRLADQTRRGFASEINDLTPADATNLVAMVDAATSPEVYEIMSSVHARTPRQITTSWVSALHTIVPAPDEETDKGDGEDMTR